MGCLWTVVSNPRFFPTVLIALDVAAGMRYAYADDWGRAVYWIAAAQITYAATYLIRH